MDMSSSKRLSAYLPLGEEIGSEMWERAVAHAKGWDSPDIITAGFRIQHALDLTRSTALDMGRSASEFILEKMYRAQKQSDEHLDRIQEEQRRTMMEKYAKSFERDLLVAAQRMRDILTDMEKRYGPQQTAA